MVSELKSATQPRWQYQQQDLAGRAVVITGGTTGIGRAIAVLLGSKGARTLIFGRHEQELRDAMNDVKHAGGDVHGLTADVSRHEDVLRVFQHADSRIGGCDILINNAAVGAGSIVQTGYPEIRYAIETDLLAYLDCAREAIERMKQKGSGHIVNIGSMSAHVRDAGQDLYVAAKAGIRGFSESLRKQVNEMGIKVTLIEPGRVGAELGGKKEPAEQEQREDQLEMLKAEDIAECVGYCLVQPKRCDIVSVQIRPHRQMI
jgi:NADP-dependent 3-hydroxy acid dehydrogenase YdfG